MFMFLCKLDLLGGVKPFFGGVSTTAQKQFKTASRTMPEPCPNHLRAMPEPCPNHLRATSEPSPSHLRATPSPSQLRASSEPPPSQLRASSEPAPSQLRASSEPLPTLPLGTLGDTWYLAPFHSTFARLCSGRVRTRRRVQQKTCQCETA